VIGPLENRRLARIFGVLGGALILLAGVLELLGSVSGALLGHASARSLVGGIDGALVDVAVAAVIVLFAVLGSRRSTDVRTASGAILVVVPVVVWFLLGTSALLLVGGLCALVAGLLLLVGPR